MNEHGEIKAEWPADPLNGNLFMVVSAPSGTGKTSICREFLKLCPRIRFSVSYTTRPPRKGEKNGVDYHFISEAMFRDRISQGFFAEWSENYGHFYGTSRKIMDDLSVSDGDLLLDLEPRGAKTLKGNYPGGIFVFILPPGIDALKSRLRRRGERQEVMQRRLDRAMDEIREIIWYDYAIINKDLPDAIDRLRSIYIAEKSRNVRLTGFLDPFLAESKTGAGAGSVDIND